MSLNFPILIPSSSSLSAAPLPPAAASFSEVGREQEPLSYADSLQALLLYRAPRGAYYQWHQTPA